ncbi:D-alanyl-D-alanine dipeptidase [filamentous cyanobacterium CCP5]|nr:D-alanyl-D-alanine dipeptidase [filamentous cyanobacterium CCP5]
MKPYHQMPIRECHEPLVAIPLDRFAVVSPHPYEELGAPYGEKSPYFLRQGVLESLIQAQKGLQAQHPGWRIQIFDAYRPVAVQQFMVDHAFQELLSIKGVALPALSPDERQALSQEVHKFWAPPSPDPATPPPHSTGAAIDVTLVDQHRNPVDMGSPIDEISSRSLPDYFASDSNPEAQQWHRHRCLLNSVMTAAGFRRHPYEWWHFSQGDQLWAWLESIDRESKNQQPMGIGVAAPERLDRPKRAITACYGRVPED